MINNKERQGFISLCNHAIKFFKNINGVVIKLRVSQDMTYKLYVTYKIK